MSRINNLFDINKIRVAEIKNSDQELQIKYELSNNFSINIDNRIRKYYSKLIDCSIYTNHKNNTFDIHIKITNSNLEKLQDIFIVISYLLADEITLYYLHQGFPQKVPHYYNFGGYDFSILNTKNLIKYPLKTIERGYKLIIDHDSLFSTIVRVMLDINTSNFAQTRFFMEFSLLEHLSQKENASGNIFQDKSAKNELKKFSKDISKYCKEKLGEYEYINSANFNKKLENILSSQNLNSRSSTKDKIKAFLENFNTENINSFVEYTDKWNELRNKKGLAHGNAYQNVPNSKIEYEEKKLYDKLHELLSEIVRYEYNKDLILNS